MRARNRLRTLCHVTTLRRGIALRHRCHMRSFAPHALAQHSAQYVFHVTPVRHVSRDCFTLCLSCFHVALLASSCHCCKNPANVCCKCMQHTLHALRKVTPVNVAHAAQYAQRNARPAIRATQRTPRNTRNATHAPQYTSSTHAMRKIRRSARNPAILHNRHP